MNTEDRKKKLAHKNTRNEIVKVWFLILVMVLSVGLSGCDFINKANLQGNNNEVTKPELKNNAIIGNREISSSELEMCKKILIVKDNLHSKYCLGEVNDNTLLEGAIKGMVSSVNESYTTYLNKEDKVVDETENKKYVKELSNAIQRNVTIEESNMLKKILEVKYELKNKYPQKSDEKTLIDSTIKGMASSLGDPYTSYLNEDDWSRMSQQTEGAYIGIGVQVGVLDDKVIIAGIFKNSPADKAEIIPGDIIVKVNDEEIGNDIKKATEIMKGTKGKKIKLTIDRKNKGIFQVNLVADEIELITVISEMVDTHVGYIRITNFDENTGKNFENKLEELSKEGAKGLILDLRDNPGGLVSTAVQVVSNFVEKGKCVVYTVDKEENKEIKNSQGGDFYDMPIVILTNNYSASASEIVTGALKDYNKATSIGEKTFGKGIVQQLLYEKRYGFGDGTALKVTTSSYYTPKGNNINKKGIEPDIEIKYPEELIDKPYNRSLDAQFKGALKVINEKVNSL